MLSRFNKLAVAAGLEPALLEQLPVTADTSAAVVGFYLNSNTLAKASLMGLVKR